MSDICGQTLSWSTITGKRKWQPEYIPDVIDFTPDEVSADGRLRIYDAKRSRNLPCIQLDSSASAISYICNAADTSIDAKIGINTRTPTHDLNVVQVDAATPLTRFTLADGTTHPLTIDALGETTIEGSLTTITGNLTVTGTISTVSDLNVSRNFITLNSDLSAATSPTEDCGVTVNRGSSTDFNLMWRESDDTFVIGLVGAYSAIATRHDTPTDAGIMVWNNTLKRCDNYSNFTFTGSRLGIGTSVAFPSPQATLHVISEGSEDALRIDDDQPSDTTYFKIATDGTTTFGNTTEATSTSAASVVLSGGLAIAKRLYVGGTINKFGNIQFDSSSVAASNIISTTDTNGNLCLVANGTGKVTITDGGGELTGAPAALLHVQYSGSESGIDCFRVDDAATTDSSYFHVEQDGCVGINCGAVQTLSPSGRKPITQTNGLQNNNGPECLATFMGPDNAGTGGITLERVSGGGSWTTTGSMISAGFHYGATDGTVVYDNSITSKQLGMAIHFDTTNWTMKFIGQNINTPVTPDVYPELSIESLNTLLELDCASVPRNVHVKSTLPAVSATSAALVVSGGVVTADTFTIAGGGTGTSRILSPTASTISSTGAMRFQGGLGIGGNLNVAGTFNAANGTTSTFSGRLHATNTIRMAPLPVTVGTTYTLDSTSHIIFYHITSGRTVILQACATAGVGRVVRIHEASGAATITINTVNSEIIHGGGVADSTTRAITSAYGYMALITDGTAWFVIASS